MFSNVVPLRPSAAPLLQAEEKAACCIATIQTLPTIAPRLSPLWSPGDELRLVFVPSSTASRGFGEDELVVSWLPIATHCTLLLARFLFCWWCGAHRTCTHRGPQAAVVKCDVVHTPYISAKRYHPVQPNILARAGRRVSRGHHRHYSSILWRCVAAYEVRSKCIWEQCLVTQFAE